MLHAECCEKGVHRWVPRRSGAPGPIAGSAEHANEVIMLCLSLAPSSLYSVGFACQRRQGTLAMQPTTDATYGTMRRHTSVSECERKTRCRSVFFQPSSKATASAICIQNKVSLKRSKEQRNNRQHSFANCSCCVFNQQPHRVCVSFYSIYASAIIYNRRGGVKHQAHAKAITRYLHSR